MKITQTKLENSTAFLDVVLDEKEVLTHKEHAVDELISTVTVKGFRQGKAPKSIASQQIDPDKLSNQILSHVLNEVVSTAIKDNKYRLLGRPVLEHIDSKENNGWTIKLSFPLYPEIKLDGFKDALVSKTKVSKKTKESKDTKDVKETNEEKIDAIYQKLLKFFNFEIPESVIEEEVNYSLEKLTNQAKSLNLSTEEYLKAVNKTMADIKKEYSVKAKEAIKLDLILLEIAKAEKIDTDIKEIVQIAKISNLPESQLGQLKSIMDRRKTIDFLLKI